MSYDTLAAEYYDPELHPTCANFREASELALARLSSYLPAGVNAGVEVGAGDSLLAALFRAQGRSITELLITDASAAMLGYSERWQKAGARLVVCSAQEIPVAESSQAYLVASLGDPYNTPDFWKEAARVLRPGGVVLFTTPSFEWASSFRLREDASFLEAEFLNADGASDHVSSLIYEPRQQAELMERAGFQVMETRHILRSSIQRTQLSRKLLVRDEPDLCVLSAYALRKLSR